MSSWYVKLTKVSDNAVHHDFMLYEGSRGEPALQLGSSPREAAQAGRWDVVKIEGMDHGAGQYIARDPLMYEFADGMLTDDPGIVRTRGELSQVRSLHTGAAHDPWNRGAIIPLYDGSDTILAVTPTAIYEDGTSKATPPSGAKYTGSVAFHGGRLFFGTAFPGNAISSNATVREANGSYDNALTWKASFVAAESEKLWAIAQNTASNVDFRWTDNVASKNPTFTANYSAGLGYVHDLGVVGPHAIFMVSDTLRPSSRVIALDTDGFFSTLMTASSVGTLLTPFLGGQIMWLSTGARAIWLPDITSFRPITWEAVSKQWGDLHLPSIGTQPIRPDYVGVGACGIDHELYFSFYGNLTKRDGNSVTGSAIFHSLLTDNGFRTHVVATPESWSVLANAHVMAMQVGHHYSAPGADDDGRHLSVLLGSGSSGSATATVQHMALWEESHPPHAYDTKVKFVRTSRHSGRHWETKSFAKIRGFAKSDSGDANSLLVKVYVDGSSNVAANIAATPSGVVELDVPAGVLGRLVALDFETQANEKLVIEFPWEVDYFAVPDQDGGDIVRLGIHADQDTPGRQGFGFKRQPRYATIEAVMDTIVASGEEWFLDWWDAGMDRWRVIPLKYETQETDGASDAASGSAIVWLTCQRVG